MTYIHTQPWALYNEIDEYAASWLENLIAAGLIANGIVDRRSIEDIRPDELRGFRQVHFFAGIGVWSYAFRRAGVSDDTALWTGSCPCQPFSAAGKGGGVDDERHLWPAFYHLIRECRPPKVYGEQVASKDGLGWLDIVSVDLERAGYAFGAVDTCSAGHGAPHIRQRLRFVAHDLRSSAGGLQHAESDRWIERWSEPGRGSITGRRSSMRMADSYRNEPRQGRDSGSSEGERVWSQSGGCGQFERMDNNDDEGLEGFGSRHQASIRHRQGPVRPASATGEFGRMVDTNGRRKGALTGGNREASTETFGGTRSNDSSSIPLRAGTTSGMADSHIIDDDGTGLSASDERREFGRSSSLQKFSDTFGEPTTSPTNGFWRDADWLFCRDGRWRPVEPGSFPLAHGAPSRVGRLRAYGNAVDAEATREFIEATLEQETLDLVAGSLFEDILG